MIYLVSVVGIVFIAAFCFVLDSAVGRVLFYWYYALGLAADRGRFVRGYRYFSRAVGVLMIFGIIAALALRAFT